MPADQTGTSPAVVTTEITHASIVEVLRKARAAVNHRHQRDVINEIDRLLDGLTPNPDASGCFWWLFAIGASDNMVADGLTPNSRKVHHALCTFWPLTLGHEIKVKLIGGPDAAAIDKAQGK